MPFNAGAFAIVQNPAGDVLLCHRRDMDVWDLPGGRVERGETPWDAAVRETREEVGLTVVVDRLVDITWKPGPEELVFTFQCHATDGTPALSDEADEVGYFAPGRLPAKLTPAKRDRVLAFVADPDRVVLHTRTDPSVRELIARGEVWW